MTQHRDFDPLDVFPAGFLDALQEALGAAHLSSNFAVVKTSSTQLSVLANTGDAQVAASIQGSWRFITSNLVATAPAGGAGTYNIWLTTRVLDTSQEDAGSFNYAFGLKLGTAPSGSGAEALSRIVGTYTWDGAAITGVKMDAPPDGSIAKIKLATDALNAFLKLAVGADRVVAFGVAATGSFGSAARTSGIVTHGLGRTPLIGLVSCGWLQTFSDAGTVPVVGSVGVLTGTTMSFVFETSNNDVTAQSCPFYWAAIG